MFVWSNLLELEQAVFGCGMKVTGGGETFVFWHTYYTHKRVLARVYLQVLSAWAHTHTHHRTPTPTPTRTHTLCHLFLQTKAEKLFKQEDWDRLEDERKKESLHDIYIWTVFLLVLHYELMQVILRRAILLFIHPTTYLFCFPHVQQKVLKLETPDNIWDWDLKAFISSSH